MAKTKAKWEPPPTGDILKRKVHPFHPWDVQHHPYHSEIEAYNEITGVWEIIAEIKGLNHVAVAEFIAALANGHNSR